MGFSPFPWHRPTADPRASRVEPLVGSGLGGRRLIRHRTSPGEALALFACGLVPVLMILMLLTGLPWPVWALGGVGVGFVILRALLRSRAARRRARERSERPSLGRGRRPPSAGSVVPKPAPGP